MQLVLASRNEKKLKELQGILSELGVNVISESQAGIDIQVEEKGSSFMENARLKAMTVMRACGLPAIADDSRLCVEALNGEPGIYSARYGGEGLDDQDRTQLLLKNMKDHSNRRCTFVCTLCCVFPDGTEIDAQGECKGELTQKPEGENGFGYDPIFYLPEKGKTFAQLTAEEKNSLSHRGRALRIFAGKLREYLEET